VADREEKPVHRIPWPARLLNLRAALVTLLTGHHAYIATGCLHGDHGYCDSMTGLSGQKRPAECKGCRAKCICPHHMTGVGE
jgi:hypothetical protein